MEFDLARKSRPIVILPYQDRWRDEYLEVARGLREWAGEEIRRVDHIGSTAVPGLGAKDVIDVQITVADLDRAESLVDRLVSGGYRERGSFRYDTFFGMSETDVELRKLYLREPEGLRRTHIHVREDGRFNQRYALLFRDYLRRSTEGRTAYQVFKSRAAQIFPESIDGYLFMKEPVLHLVYEAAQRWADQIDWRPGDDAD